MACHLTTVIWAVLLPVIPKSCLGTVQELNLLVQDEVEVEDALTIRSCLPPTNELLSSLGLAVVVGTSKVLAQRVE